MEGGLGFTHTTLSLYVITTLGWLTLMLQQAQREGGGGDGGIHQMQGAKIGGGGVRWLLTCRDGAVVMHDYPMTHLSSGSRDRS